LVALLSSHRPGSEIHQLAEKILGRLSPILDHERDRFFLIFGKRNAGMFENDFGLIVKFIERILRRRGLLLSD
jgi:hypothetical protein